MLGIGEVGVKMVSVCCGIFGIFTKCNSLTYLDALCRQDSDITDSGVLSGRRHDESMRNREKGGRTVVAVDGAGAVARGS